MGSAQASYTAKPFWISALWQKKILFIPWGGVCLLCDQVTKVLRFHPHGRIWWMMRIWAPDKPLKSQYCLNSQMQYCTTLSRITLGEWGWGGLRAVASVSVVVFPLIMLTIKLHLLCLYLSLPVTGTSLRVCLSSRDVVFLLCILTSTTLVYPGTHC